MSVKKEHLDKVGKNLVKVFLINFSFTDPSPLLNNHL